MAAKAIRQKPLPFKQFKITSGVKHFFTAIDNAVEKAVDKQLGKMTFSDSVWTTKNRKTALFGK